MKIRENVRRKFSKKVSLESRLALCRAGKNVHIRTPSPRTLFVLELLGTVSMGYLRLIFGSSFFVVGHLNVSLTLQCDTKRIERITIFRIGIILALHGLKMN